MFATHTSPDPTTTSTEWAAGRRLFNVAQLYVRMAEGFCEGKSGSPDFYVAVNRHQLLDVIQKASDTGIRQIL